MKSLPKWLLAAVAVFVMVAGCGGGNGTVADTGSGGGTEGGGTGNGDTGGGGTGSEDTGGGATGGGETPPPTSASTPIGRPIGTPVSTVIGIGGGQLATADSTLTIEIPAGAIDSEKTVSIQEITNEAHGAHGRAFRLGPEGLQTVVPMTIRFHYTDSDLTGTDLRFLSIAYQDAQQSWHAYKAPSVDSANRTLEVHTRHFSDWSMLAGVQILPHEARVKVGESVPLQVMVCERINEEDPDTHAVFVGLVEECKPSPLDGLASGHWAVNAQEGGSPKSGTVVASTDHTLGIGTYTAPSTKPATNTVSVSVQYAAPFDPTFQLLVATVTIEDQPGCEWLRSADSLSADVSFDAFTFNSAGEFDSYTGNHAGRLIGTLTKVTGTGLSFDEWVTYFSPLTGKSVSISDTHNHFYPGEEYTETLLGSGSPHDGLDAPSLVSLKVNYGSCTYDLFASYTVDGIATRDSSTSSKPIGIGGLYIYGQTFLPGQADAGSIEGERAINAIFDTTRTGYVPLQLDTSWSLTGQTTAHWILSVSP